MTTPPTTHSRFQWFIIIIAHSPLFVNIYNNVNITLTKLRYIKVTYEYAILDEI